MDYSCDENNSYSCMCGGVMNYKVEDVSRRIRDQVIKVRNVPYHQCSTCFTIEYDINTHLSTIAVNAFKRGESEVDYENERRGGICMKSDINKLRAALYPSEKDFILSFILIVAVFPMGVWGINEMWDNAIVNPIVLSICMVVSYIVGLVFIWYTRARNISDDYIESVRQIREGEFILYSGVKLKHYKGGEYVVQDFATDSETGEKVVIYKDSTSKTWVRTAKMFFETVEHEGEIVPRFIRVK